MLSRYLHIRIIVYQSKYVLLGDTLYETGVVYRESNRLCEIRGTLITTENRRKGCICETGEQILKFV